MQAYADYHDVMDLTEEIVTACSTSVAGSSTVTYQGTEINLSPPFRRATMHELVQDATGGLALAGHYAPHLHQATQPCDWRLP